MYVLHSRCLTDKWPLCEQKPVSLCQSPLQEEQDAHSDSMENARQMNAFEVSNVLLI